MSELRIQEVQGSGIEPWLGALAELRIRVFREWPYLYDGSLAYEAEYLKTYARSPESLFVLALAGDAVIGCSTGVPLADETANLQQPFVRAGIAVEDVFYFGESVLDRAWRGKGLGHRFFDAREAYARRLRRFTCTAFCAVIRDPADPRRPPDARALDPFWRARGYAPRRELEASIEWQEIGEARSTPKPMRFWLRALDP